MGRIKNVKCIPGPFELYSEGDRVRLPNGDLYKLYTSERSIPEWAMPFNAASENTVPTKLTKAMKNMVIEYTASPLRTPSYRKAKQ